MKYFIIAVFISSLALNSCTEDLDPPAGKSNKVTVSTTQITSITTNSAASGGTVVTGGADSVTMRGVCWSTGQNPTTSNSKTNNGSGDGIFTASLTSLTTGTTYYLRAYAITGTGTFYGNQRSFRTN